MGKASISDMCRLMCMIKINRVIGILAIRPGNILWEELLIDINGKPIQCMLSIGSIDLLDIFTVYRKYSVIYKNMYRVYVWMYKCNIYVEIYLYILV